jgi:hypothetical protein
VRSVGQAQSAPGGLNLDRGKQAGRCGEPSSTRRIFWEPAPGDLPTADGDPSKVGIPAGYRSGYSLIPEGDDDAVVTEVFDCDPFRQTLLREGGEWINGTN